MGLVASPTLWQQPVTGKISLEIIAFKMYLSGTSRPDTILRVYKSEKVRIENQKY